MKLSEYIRGKIAENKWTYNQAAEFYDVSPTTITGIVNGKFDIPTMTLVNKLAKKESIESEDLLNSLSFLPITVENMNASSKVMHLIGESDKQNLDLKSIELFTKMFKAYCHEYVSDYDETFIYYIDHNTQIPEEDSILPLMLDEAVLHSDAFHTMPENYIAFHNRENDSPYGILSDIWNGNVIIWGFSWMVHQSIGKVALTTNQNIDQLLIKAFKCPFYRRYYIFFNCRDEYQYAVNCYYKSIKHSPFEVYFAFFPNADEFSEIEIFPYRD